MGRAPWLALASALGLSGCGGTGGATATPADGAIASPDTAPAVLPREWIAARLVLRLRLLPPEAPAHWATLVWREDLPGLRSVLVGALPGTNLPVPRTLAEGWGVDEAEWFRTALANQRNAPPPVAESMVLGDGVVLQAFQGDGAFMATEALCLDRLAGVRGTHGTLVAVPVPSVLLALPVEAATLLPGLERLSHIAPELAHKGPAGVSRDLYWWDGARHHRIPVTPGPEDVAVAPPDAFVDLLNRLAAEMVPPAAPTPAPATPR